MNPWLEEWRVDYSYEAKNLRALAAGDVAIKRNLGARMRELATALDEVASFRLTLGCSETLEAAASRTKDLTYSLKKDTFDQLPLSSESVDRVRTLLRETSRKVTDLADSAQEMADSGRIEELQSEVGSVGSQLMQLSFYDLSALGRDVAHSMREIGLSMRLLRVARIYMDGGASLRRLVEDVVSCTSRLQELVRLVEGELPE